MNYEVLECALDSDQSLEQGRHFQVTVVAAETPEVLLSGLRSRKAEEPRLVLVRASVATSLKKVQDVYNVGRKLSSKGLVDRFLTRKKTLKKRKDGAVLFQDATSFKRLSSLVTSITKFLSNAHKRQRPGLYLAVLDDNRFNEFIQAEKQPKRLEIDPRLDDLEKTYIGKSPLIQEVRQQLLTVARYDKLGVLILGETGTGKSQIAELIHRYSERRGKTFKDRSCADIPDEAFESEMYGTWKGAGTGAVDRQGVFETAHEGTLFLDEVGCISDRHQEKFLQVLRKFEITRLGAGNRPPRKVDVRVIFATNANLKSEVQDGKFRSDLYYRVNNGICIRTPALREHPEDIPLIASKCWSTTWAELGNDGKVPELSQDILTAMQEYAWFGNVPELQSVIKKMAFLSLKTATDPSLPLFRSIAKEEALELSPRQVKSQANHILDRVRDELDALAKVAARHSIKEELDIDDSIIKSLRCAFHNVEVLRKEHGASLSDRLFQKLREVQGSFEDILRMVDGGKTEQPGSVLVAQNRNLAEAVQWLTEERMAMREDRGEATLGSKIVIDVELLAIREVLAKNNHDIWMEMRLAEGWRYGKERNDKKMTHPDLVHYDALPEGEKQFDRNMAIGTIRALHHLGYRVTKDPGVKTVS